VNRGRTRRKETCILMGMPSTRPSCSEALMDED
jgi:hypothetical protein